MEYLALWVPAVVQPRMSLEKRLKGANEGITLLKTIGSCFLVEVNDLYVSLGLVIKKDELCEGIGRDQGMEITYSV